MAVGSSKRRVASGRIEALAIDLLEASTLCAIATVSGPGRAHINTAYFAWSGEFDLVWLSEPRAQHSKNIAANPSVAVAVYDSAQNWGSSDRGIQLLGKAEAIAPREDEWARRLYTERFPRFAGASLGAYRFYRLRIDRLKLFAEETLGGGIFVTARVGRDRRPAWQRTDVYDSNS
ncbi:MAG TPA: pyridoxamine 5'-phosphate oxidase family protein [Gaiellaceae bacterium]